MSIRGSAERIYDHANLAVGKVLSPASRAPGDELRGLAIITAVSIPISIVALSKGLHFEGYSLTYPNESPIPHIETPNAEGLEVFQSGDISPQVAHRALMGRLQQRIQSSE